MLSGVQRFSHQTQREVEEKKKRNDHFGLCTKPKHNVVMHEECEKITRDYLKTYIVYVCRYVVVSDQAEHRTAQLVRDHQYFNGLLENKSIFSGEKVGI